jgi:hypothetical protein
MHCPTSTDVTYFFIRSIESVEIKLKCWLSVPARNLLGDFPHFTRPIRIGVANGDAFLEMSFFLNRRGQAKPDI